MAHQTRRRSDSSVDAYRLLPHLRGESVNTAPVATVVYEVNGASYAVAGGDAARLRGIPAISKNVGSAIPGTQPEQVVCGDD